MSIRVSLRLSIVAVAKAKSCCAVVLLARRSVYSCSTFVSLLYSDCRDLCWEDNLLNWSRLARSKGLEDKSFNWVCMFVISARTAEEDLPLNLLASSNSCTALAAVSNADLAESSKSNSSLPLLATEARVVSYNLNNSVEADPKESNISVSWDPTSSAAVATESTCAWYAEYICSVKFSYWDTISSRLLITSRVELATKSKPSVYWSAVIVPELNSEVNADREASKLLVMFSPLAILFTRSDKLFTKGVTVSTSNRSIKSATEVTIFGRAGKSDNSEAILLPISAIFIWALANLEALTAANLVAASSRIVASIFSSAATTAFSSASDKLLRTLVISSLESWLDSAMLLAAIDFCTSVAELAIRALYVPCRLLTLLAALSVTLTIVDTAWIAGLVNISMPAFRDSLALVTMAVRVICLLLEIALDMSESLNCPTALIVSAKASILATAFSTITVPAFTDSIASLRATKSPVLLSALSAKPNWASAFLRTAAPATSYCLDDRPNTSLVLSRKLV